MVRGGAYVPRQISTGRCHPRIGLGAAVRSTEIGVGVKDGIVTLSGVVDSHASKRAAERAAGRVRGVKAVSSQLEVRPVGPAERTDGDIAWAAANALAWNALVPQGRVSVSVSRGWIVLEGAVDQIPEEGG